MAVHLPGQRLLVVVVAIADLEQSEQGAGTVAQRQPRAGMGLTGNVGVDGERDGQRPDHARGQAHRVHDRVQVVMTEKAVQRAERAAGDQLEVRFLPRIEEQLRPAVRFATDARDLIGARPAIDELAAVRANEPVLTDLCACAFRRVIRPSFAS